MEWQQKYLTPREGKWFPARHVSNAGTFRSACTVRVRCRVRTRWCIGSAHTSHECRPATELFIRFTMGGFLFARRLSQCLIRIFHRIPSICSTPHIIVYSSAPPKNGPSSLSSTWLSCAVRTYSYKGQTAAAIDSASQHVYLVLQNKISPWQSLHSRWQKVCDFNAQHNKLPLIIWKASQLQTHR